jgi:hypothetical protein
MKSIVALIATLAAVSMFAGCAGLRDKMPDWMPGSGAIKVNLAPAEEVPPAKSDGKGTGTFRVAEDGTITGSVTTEGVKGTMAHIHQGAKGHNGPVIVPLTKNGDTYSVPEGKKLSADQIKALKEGNLYVNVHSDRYKGGEVRAQLQP